MNTYYNDNDPHACKWLKNLIDRGLLPQGNIDSRSINEVSARDVSTAKHAHFFSGIGGWPYAAYLAGWPEDVPLWTASLPCQPFSKAGKRIAEKDERHLWPEFYRLIVQCRPSIVVGEQVGSKIGRSWLSNVFSDMENIGYITAAANLPAASVGAPHARQRFYWCALAYAKELFCLWSKSNRPCLQQKIQILPELGNRNAAAVRARMHWANPQPRLFAMANGIPNHVDIGRGYGNAIVPKVGAEFLGAVLDILKLTILVIP